ncbi:uncharacterized protein LOC131886897 [Tigriopus californicus]|uniref:uncharacterized protein LOC131886897 n=1 Tax=Tigriopus californicus TaxID=6832 RepID=UPI0027D9D4A3|nr:uncharacterized protein LOC131886897 [Tigriopus californicus]
MNDIQETVMTTTTHAKKPVRRGNTSGLIGLWNSRVIPGEDSLSDELGNGSSVDQNSNSDLLQIRERAMRRISVRDPPSPASLEANRRKPYMPQTLSAPKANGPSLSMLGDTLRVDPSLKTRKTSELVRPTFSILKDISEERGMFAGGILHERPHSSSHEKTLPTVVIENKVLTDDSIQRANTPRRGSGAGLGRSKSVKINRVKFGLMLDATEGKPLTRHAWFLAPIQRLDLLKWCVCFHAAH